MLISVRWTERFGNKITVIPFLTSFAKRPLRAIRKLLHPHCDYVNRPMWRIGVWCINMFGRGVIHHTCAILTSTQCDDISLARSQPRPFTLNRDISVSRTLPSGHQDRPLQTRTVPEKLAWLVTLCNRPLNRKWYSYSAYPTAAIVVTLSVLEDHSVANLT